MNLKKSKSKLSMAVGLALLPLVTIATISSVNAEETRPVTANLDISVFDINQNPDSAKGSNPRDFFELNGKLYFTAQDANGIQLWSFDKATDKATLTHQINPTGSSHTDSYTLYNGNIYFSATDGVNGIELWMLDSSTNETSLVADINEGEGNSSATNFIVFDGKLIFSANNGVNGHELWAYDSVTDEAVMVQDLYPGSQYSYGEPKGFTEYKGKLYFSAVASGDNGREFWVYDGSTATLLMEIYPGWKSGNPDNFIIFNDLLYFTADDGVDGNELWVYDGEEGSVPVLAYDIDAGEAGGGCIGICAAGSASSNARNFTEFNGKLYFTASVDGDIELYEFNGTDAPIIAQNIRKGGSSNPKALTVMGDHLYFVAQDDINGQQIWSYNGYNATALTELEGHNFDELYVYDNTLYVTANDGVYGNELHVFDTETETLSLIQDIQAIDDGSDVNSITSAGDNLYFRADEGNGLGAELYQYNDTSMDVSLVVDLVEDGNGNPELITAFNNKLYFAYKDATFGKELFEFDSASEGEKVTLIVDANDGLDYNNNPSSGSIANLTVVGDTLFFTGRDAAYNNYLYMFDGETVSTISNDNYSSPSNLIAFNDALYFTAGDPTYTTGTELYTYNAETGLAELAANIADDTSRQMSSYPNNLMVADGKLYFTAADETYDNEIYSFDGTTLTKIDTNEFGSGRPNNITIYNGKPYFVYYSPAGNELYYYDENSAEDDKRILVKDIAADEFDENGNLVRANSSSPLNLTVYKNKLYFTANDQVHGTELWVHDSATGETEMVNDFHAGAGSSFPKNFTVHNGKLFFTADDAVVGNELYSLYEDTPLTGTITVTGDLVKGLTLTATYELEGDEEVVEMSYQWLRDGVAIDGATEVTYSLTEDDIDTNISFVISAIDLGANVEVITSTEYGPVDGDNDNDGIGNNVDDDDDGDGVADVDDAFPLDATETVDTDGDGIGNNADTDDDGDGVEDSTDALPLDATESVDTDGDGIGNNADTDDDGDGVADSEDVAPLDPNKSKNSSGGSMGIFALALSLMVGFRRKLRK